MRFGRHELVWVGTHLAGTSVVGIVLFVILLALSLTRVQQLTLIPETLTCLHQDGGACDAEIASEFSWSTWSTNPVIRFQSPEAVVLTATVAAPAAAAAVRAGFMLYRAQGILRPRFLVLGSGDARRPDEFLRSGRPFASTRPMEGTTPDYIRWTLSAGDRFAEGTKIVVRAERTFGKAEIGFGPILSWQSARADVIWRNGWLGALVLPPFCALLLLPLLLPLLLLAGRHVFRSRSHTSDGEIRCLMAAGFVGLIAAGFALPLWYWIPLRAIQLYLPDPIGFQGELGALLRTAFETAWPSGVIQRQVTPDDLALRMSGLSAFAANIHIGAAALVSALLVGAIVGWGTIPRLRFRLPPVGHAPMAAAVLAFAVILYLEAWRMPIAAPGAALVGLGTVLILVSLVVAMVLIVPVPANIPARPTLTGRDWIVLAAIAAVYFALRFHDVFIPGTIFTDETVAYGGAYVLLGAAFRWTRALPAVLRAFVVCAGCALIATAVLGLLRLSKAKWSWLAIGLMAFGAIAFIVASANVPITTSDGMAMFRYPPLNQVTRFLFALLDTDYLTAGRIATLVFAAVCVGLIYALARAIGARTGTALFASALFAAAHIIHFFAVINGDSYFHLAATIAVMVAVVIWLRTAQAEMLLWAAVLTLVAYFFRQTSIELVATIAVTAAAAAFSDERFRTRGTLRALAFCVVAVGVPAVLFQKLLVGSWLFWVNPPLTWHTIWLSLHDQPERWFAEPWTFAHATGAALVVVFMAALLMTLADPRSRLVAFFFLSFFVFDLLIQHIFARSVEYQGYDRLLLPLHVPVIILIGLAVEFVFERVHRLAGVLFGVALLALVVAGSRYRYEPVQCVRPLEYAPLAQYNGQSFFFVPEAALRAALPADTRSSEAAFVVPGFIAMRTGFGQYASGSQDALYTAARQRGQRYLAFLAPADETTACYARMFYMLPEASETLYMIEPRHRLDPKRFHFFGDWDTPPLRMVVFEVL